MLIWGHKTAAMFDVWSFEHFANGICMAAVAAMIIRKISKKIEIQPTSQKIIGFTLVLAASLFWECAEHYIEAGIFTGMLGERITHWFQGVEHWSNRLIGDTLTVMLGWYVYNKKKNLAVPAKIFSVLWMLIHIFVFPDSMYLQRLLLRIL
ncbi:MAG: hypothetical protein LBI12_01050 [Treponema sp.]|jgi:hypothetical protein|nr:hypothetical protein [Treponema sp.]